MNHLRQFSRRSFLRRSAAATLAITAGGIAIPQLRDAAAQNGDYELVSTADGVRVRNAPSLSGTVLGHVNTGDVVSVTGETAYADGYSWIPVFVHDLAINGYVAGEFFQRPGGDSGWIRGTPVYVTSDNVNLRAGAGLGYKIIANFDAWTPAFVNDGPTSADGYSWYNIAIGGTTGWMAADFLAEGQLDGPSGWAPGSYVMTQTALNLRSGAGLAHGIIDTYSSGQTATILRGPTSADGYSWYQVEVWDPASTIGWFAGEYLEMARFEPTGARHEVVDGPLNLRSGASLDAAVITTLPTGSVFVIADASFAQADGYTWMSVYVEENPSLTGWVAQGFSVEI